MSVLYKKNRALKRILRNKLQTASSRFREPVQPKAKAENYAPAYTLSTAIPESYNDNYVRVIPKDPVNTFIYWENSQDKGKAVVSENPSVRPPAQQQNNTPPKPIPPTRPSEFENNSPQQDDNRPRDDFNRHNDDNNPRIDSGNQQSRGDNRQHDDGDGSNPRPNNNPPRNECSHLYDNRHDDNYPVPSLNSGMFHIGTNS